MKKFEMPEVQVITFEEDIMSVTLSTTAAYDEGFTADAGTPGIF